MAGQRIRITKLTTIGEVMSEHRRIYCGLRRGKIEPGLATRLSQMLVAHRGMVEVALLEQQIEDLRLQLASERALPPLITQRTNGTLVNSE